MGGPFHVPTIQVGDTEWGGEGGALHVPFCIGRGRGVEGGHSASPTISRGKLQNNVTHPWHVCCCGWQHILLQ